MKIELSPEIQFQTARSGGKGGQNVNKVETMVEGRWLIAESTLVTAEQKAIIAQKLANKITADGFLLVKSQTERTQLANKQQVVTKINLLVGEALKKKRTRIATKLPKAVKEKNLELKKLKSTIKAGRKKVKPGDYK